MNGRSNFKYCEAWRDQDYRSIFLALQVVGPSNQDCFFNFAKAWPQRRVSEEASNLEEIGSAGADDSRTATQLRFRCRHC